MLPPQEISDKLDVVGTDVRIDSLLEYQQEIKAKLSAMPEVLRSTAASLKASTPQPRRAGR